MDNKELAQKIAVWIQDTQHTWIDYNDCYELEDSCIDGHVNLIELAEYIQKEIKG